MPHYCLTNGQNWLTLLKSRMFDQLYSLRGWRPTLCPASPNGHILSRLCLLLPLIGLEAPFSRELSVEKIYLFFPENGRRVSEKCSAITEGRRGERPSDSCQVLSFSKLPADAAESCKYSFHTWKWIIFDPFRQTWVAAHSIEVTETHLKYLISPSQTNLCKVIILLYLRLHLHLLERCQ